MRLSAELKKYLCVSCFAFFFVCFVFMCIRMINRLYIWSYRQLFCFFVCSTFGLTLLTLKGFIRSFTHLFSQFLEAWYNSWRIKWTVSVLLISWFCVDDVLMSEYETSYLFFLSKSLNTSIYPPLGKNNGPSRRLLLFRSTWNKYMYNYVCKMHSFCTNLHWDYNLKDEQ